MGKKPGKKQRDLEERLRRLGLRKALAKRIAENAANVGGHLPKSARKTIKGVRARVDDLGAGVRKPSAGDREAEEVASGGGVEAEKRGQGKALTKRVAKKLRKTKKKSVKKAGKVKEAATGKPEGREKRKGKGKGKGMRTRVSSPASCSDAGACAVVGV